MRGKLYVIATPIGNLGDITLRALDTIKQVDLLLSEDTRETDKLLQHFQIKKPQISYRDQNHERVFDRIMLDINNGKNIGLTCDSGTPLISDPGYKLVRDMVGYDVEVEVLPGPNAAIAALSISGLPTDKFAFLGFLPKKDGDRRKLLQEYKDIDATLTLYESPFRMKDLLLELKENLGDRKACICNDITKLHQKIWRGSVSDLIKEFSLLEPKGEFVVLVSKGDL